MRLPKLRSFTEEQKNVYLYAPSDTHVLVQGPPGTGKTLIACLRAIELKKRGVPVALGMFNRVLVKYASNVGHNETDVMPTQTVRSWFSEWWYSAGLPPHPDGGNICIEVPFEQKDEVRHAGARWNKDEWRPWQQGRKGVWSVSYDAWKASSQVFSAWPLWQPPPALPDSPDECNWDAIFNHMMDHEAAIPDSALSVGVLLIDEGQDFAPGFYKVLALLSALAASRGKKITHPLRCFVLADENQQLTQFNSTLNEIQSALKISSQNRFTLLDNFRNTCEIAELARSFFDDVGVLPRLPARKGERPTYVECNQPSECISRIVTWMVNHPGKEAGVFVFREKKREELQKALTAAVEKIKGRKIQVQSYSWDSRQVNRADALVFDVPDVITVLNVQSCKGLEFDAVFIVDLHEAPIRAGLEGKFRMQMFVGASRAREWMQIIETRKSPESSAFRQELPPSDILVRESAISGNERIRVSGTVAPAVARTAADSVNDWAAWAKKFATEQGLAYEDLRPNNGCFWVYASQQFSRELEKQGFRYTERKKGWWKI